MATYTEMVDKVLDWSNRDTDVISYSNIKDFINFASDEIYRHLRIAPMEHTVRYSPITEAQEMAGTNTLTIPSDAIEFMLLYLEDSDVRTGRQVYEPKSDLTSFYNEYLVKYASRYYTRDRNNLVLYPDFSEGETYALHYYRRFPEADARYSVSSANNSSGLLYFDSDSIANLQTAVRTAETVTVFDRDPDLTRRIVTNPTGLKAGFYLGRLTSNWLRDENEKAILFGALKEAFDFLNEMETSEKYRAKFVDEIQKLNQEDKQRMVMGGNVQVHFTANNLI